MAKKNALLIYPEFETSFWSFKYALEYLGKKSSMPPLGLLTLASMFPADYNLRLVDMNVQPLTDGDIAWADIVFTSSMIVQRRSLAHVAERVARSRKLIVAGGPFPTSYWQEIGDIDYLLLGEVEEIFSGFLQDLEQGTAKCVYAPKERPSIMRAPLPRYDLINMRDYGAMLLQFSRGCPFDCEFCDITKIYGRIPRTKSNEQMLAEFKLLYDLGYQGSLFLVDDNFIGNRRDALRFLKALVVWQQERNFPFDLYTEASMNLVEYPELMDAMAAAGFTSVFVGIETPTPEALITTKKKQNVDKDDPEYPLHAVQTLLAKGFEVMAGFILGLDGDKLNAAEIIARFIKEAHIPQAMTGLLTALKDTNLYQRLEKEGRLVRDTTGTNITTHLNFIPEIPAEKLVEDYKRLINELYDPGLDNYFDRCLKMILTLDRSKCPKVTSTPLTIGETMRFVYAAIRQLMSQEGPAYARFLKYVAVKKPSMFRFALAMGAKGHHLRKVTKEVLAVDDFEKHLTSAIHQATAELTKRAHDNGKAAHIYILRTIAHARHEYKRIHKDFRHCAEMSFISFLRSMEELLSAQSSAAC